MIAAETTETVDPFAAYADARGYKPRTAKPRAPKVVQSEAEAPMVPSAAEKQQREATAQIAQYKRAKRAEHAAMLAGPHGAPYGVMVRILRGLSQETAPDLLAHLRSGWLDKLSVQERMTVLQVIDSRIIYLRIADGRAPIDDPLPGESPSLFLLVRKIITGV